MISKKEVQHIAKLARLALNEKEIEEMKKTLSSILDYIEKLKEVDISGVSSYISSGKIQGVMREDKEDKEKESRNKKLLELAPEEKGGYLKVKQVL
jgi:aspartyl-tRNA(Asn)/glutamyl-tRNA(Gln) amidotransferase subunit C